MAGIHRPRTLIAGNYAYAVLLGMVGNCRSRTLPNVRLIGFCLLGMAGNHRSRTLGQPEAADIRQIPVDQPLKKAESARGFPRDRVAFSHKTLPSWRTGDR